MKLDNFFTAHPTKSHGTLECRHTVAEKHCFKQWTELLLQQQTLWALEHQTGKSLFLCVFSLCSHLLILSLKRITNNKKMDVSDINMTGIKSSVIKSANANLLPSPKVAEHWQSSHFWMNVNKLSSYCPFSRGFWHHGTVSHCSEHFSLCSSSPPGILHSWSLLTQPCLTLLLLATVGWQLSPWLRLSRSRCLLKLHF